MKRPFLLAAPLLLASLAAQALDVHVMQAWSRATPPGADTGVGYLTLHNGGTRAAKLVSISSPRATAVEMHESRLEGGLSRMSPVADLIVPAGGMVRFEPNGKHLMLVGLKSPLQAGEHVPVSFTFEGEPPVQAELVVRPLGATAAPAPASGTGHDHLHD